MVALLAAGLLVVNAPIASSAPGDFVPITPYRAVDTRTGLGGTATLQPGQTLWFDATGAGGVPATGVSAVVLNITAVNPTARGHLTAWPGHQVEPTASVLNFDAGQVIGNSVIVGTGTGAGTAGSGGGIKVRNASGLTDVVIDITGWFSTSSAFTPTNPQRVMDTRIGLGGAPFNAGATQQLAIAGTGTIPTLGVQAVALNITAVTPTSAGFITAWPSDEPFPNASILNFGPGDVVGNGVVVDLDANGAVNLFNSGGVTNLVVDVMGWFANDGEYTSINPSRVADTRSSLGGGTLGSGETRVFSMLGAVPAGALAVAANLTVVSPTASGHFTAWPADVSTMPLASSLNFAAGDVRGNAVIIGLDGQGALKLSNAAGNADVVIDVLGYFGAATPAPSATNVVSTIAGPAGFPFPHEVATDNAGQLYISDFFNHQVYRRDSATGALTVVAGTGTAGFSGDGGAATLAQLNNPVSMAFDAGNNLYIADHTNHAVRRVDAATGIITTVAGDGTAGDSGDGGPATAAQLDIPEAVAVSSTHLYIGVWNSQKVKRVDLSTGIIDTLAAIPYTSAMAVDSSDNLYVASMWQDVVYKITPNGTQTIFAGTPGLAGSSGDGGQASAALINHSNGLDVAPDDSLIISDSYNRKIRRVDAATGIITTIVGTGTAGYTGDGGAALAADIDPDGVAVGNNGEIYWGQPGYNVVRAVTLP